MTHSKAKPINSEMVNTIGEASMDVIPEERGSGHGRNGNSLLGKVGDRSSRLELWLGWSHLDIRNARECLRVFALLPRRSKE